MMKSTMNQTAVAVVAVLFVPSILLLYFSPDVLTLIMVALMATLCAVGFLLALMPIIRYGGGFQEAFNKIEHLRSIQPDQIWSALIQSETLFQVPEMDEVFYDYKLSAEEAKKTGKASLSDLEDILNTEFLAIKSWRSVAQLIPNTQTGIGILGTFVGLLTGIGNIGFSSAETVVTSVQTLLSGINVAFYTSIAGVIFSILFSIVYRTVWSMTQREMQLFYREYHTYVRQSAEDAERERQFAFQQEILEYLRDMRERELLNL